MRIAGKGCDRCSEEKRALVVRGSEARPVPQRKDELLLGKMCPNALCKLECIHSLEFQLNLNQSRRCQTLGCDGQLLKRKPRGKLPHLARASSQGPFKSSTSPGRPLPCRQDPASANLLSCVPITSLQSLSGSLPVSGPFPPSSPSRLPDRAGGSQQHWAVLPRQSYPCLDYKCPTFPIQLVLSSPFCHRDKPRKVWTLSFSDDKN